MRRVIKGLLVVSGVAVGLGAVATLTPADSADWGDYQVDDRRSGYTYATAATRAMQDDDFVNPAMLRVDDGEEIWNTVDGDAGKSCASCHDDAAESMRGVAASYPVYRGSLGKLQNIEQRINECRVDNMQAEPWKWESSPLLSMTVYVRHQSRGIPISVAIDGPAAPFYEKGKEFFNQRRGLLDMACKHCHQDFAGNMVRANTLSEGQTTGFPVYRLKWQKVGSTHRRFRGCNKQVRAQPYGYGSDEYVNLELFVAWRGRGLLVETPAVRN
jgi:sulfur-oxidizing protein SoxA